MRYRRLIGIPVANNIYCLTMEEEEYKDIPQIILICPIDYGEKLPLFACKNKLFKLISELNIEIF